MEYPVPGARSPLNLRGPYASCIVARLCLWSSSAALSARLRTAVQPESPRRTSRDRPAAPEEQLKKFHLPPGFEIAARRRRAESTSRSTSPSTPGAGCGSPDPIEYPFPRRRTARARTPSRSSTTSPPTAGPARSPPSPTASTSPSASCPTRRKGAIVFSIPNIYRMTDTDGDGKADKREVALRALSASRTRTA